MRIRIFLFVLFFRLIDLYGNNLPPDTPTVPVSSTGVLALGSTLNLKVEESNTILVKGDMVWGRIYETDFLYVDSLSEEVSVVSHIVNSSKPNSNGQRVRIFGASSQDVNGTDFQLTAFDANETIIATILFEIYVTKGLNLQSPPPAGKIAPGGLIIDTSVNKSPTDVVTQNLYGVIKSGASLKGGSYKCSLICKSYAN